MDGEGWFQIKWRGFAIGACFTRQTRPARSTLSACQGSSGAGGGGLYIFKALEQRADHAQGCRSRRGDGTELVPDGVVLLTQQQGEEEDRHQLQDELGCGEEPRAASFFTFPKLLRPYFRHNRRLFSEISRLIFAILQQFYDKAAKRPVRTGMVLAYQF